MKNKTIATTKEKTMKVFQEANYSFGNESAFFYLTDDDFEVNNLCEAYDEYGEKIGCEKAGCNSSNSEVSHTQMRYETYWDGRKYISIIVDGNENINANVLSVNQEKEQEILDDFKNAELEYEDRNIRVLKGRQYHFVFNLKTWGWDYCSAYKDTDENKNNFLGDKI